MTRFEDMSVNTIFDFIDDKNLANNSFFCLCRKISPRKYVAIDSGLIYQIGTVKCEVFHVRTVETRA